MSDASAKLNPRIKTVNIGIRELRQIKVYPLSIYDQTQFTEAIVTVFAIVSAGGLEAMKDEEAVSYVTEAIRKNMGAILEIATDDATLKEVDNSQFMEIAQIIYDNNYEDFLKNLNDLLKKIGKHMPEMPSNFKGSLPVSSEKQATD